MYSNPISTTYTVKNKNNEIVKQGNFSFKFYLSKARPFLIFDNDIFFGEYDVLKIQVIILVKRILYLTTMVLHIFNQKNLVNAQFD